jgi:hypothetical protein
LVDTYGTDGSQWHSFLKTAANLQSPASGFLLALSDCYVTEFMPQVTDIVPQELNLLAGLCPIASSIDALPKSGNRGFGAIDIFWQYFRLKIIQNAPEIVEIERSFWMMAALIMFIWLRV